MLESPLSVGRADLFDTVLLAPAGVLDLLGGPILVGAVADVLGEADRATLVLDLAAVGAVDSSGLRALLDVDRLCVAAGTELLLCRLSGAAERILATTGLAARFTILDASGGDRSSPEA